MRPFWYVSTDQFEHQLFQLWQVNRGQISKQNDNEVRDFSNVQTHLSSPKSFLLAQKTRKYPSLDGVYRLLINGLIFVDY